MRFPGIGVAFAAMVALAAAGCNDGLINSPDSSVIDSGAQPARPRFSSNADDYPPPGTPCGVPLVADLKMGNTKVGTVKIQNEGSKLFVIYHTNSPYFMSETRTAVGERLADIPRDHRGYGDPWSYPYAGDHDPVESDWYYTIFYDDWGFRAGQEIVVSVMAGVVYPTTSNWSGNWDWRQAWMAGQRIHPSSARETYVKYTLQPCGPNTPPPPPPIVGGAVTITFDDGWLTTYTNAYPVLREFGIRGNVAVNSEPIDGGWSDYMTLPQLQELSLAGWSIVNHTTTHRDMQSLTDAELVSEVRDNKAWIERNGFQGSHVFIVPFHSWGPRELAVVKQYSTAARGYSISQFGPPDRYESYPPADPYALTGFEPEFAPYTTPEGREMTRAVVEKAVRENKFVDIFFHQIPAENVGHFRELMRLIAPYVTNIRPYHQLFPAPVVVN